MVSGWWWWLVAGGWWLAAGGLPVVTGDGLWTTNH